MMNLSNELKACLSFQFAEELGSDLYYRLKSSLIEEGASVPVDEEEFNKALSKHVTSLKIELNIH